MLISKGYQEGDIVSFKLTNGDEIVAKIISTDTDSYEVAKPCTVMPGPQGMGLIQSLFTADSDINIKLSKTHVIMHAPSVDQMQKHYIKTTTGIEPVTRGSILT
jgi:hypothetical protein